MTLYVDSSSMLKMYFPEPDSEAAEQLLMSDPLWVTGRHTVVEVRRNLARQLEGNARAAAREQFRRDWESTTIVELDGATCDLAASFAEITGVRTLDALHMGAAQRAGGGALPFATHDLRLAQAARSLGWTVLGA